MKNFIPIAEPLFDGNELKYLTDCINTGWISSVGSYVRKFEQGFAEYVGCKYGAAVHTGTAALHLALAALDIGPGDEVIIPDLTFASTANAVLYTGAKPVLVDVENDTWNIDPELIEKAVTERTKAIIPVHLYGHPCDMDRIMEISRKQGISIIEDAAEAHGAEYKGRIVGGIGSIGCFSFFANKIITTGEGGICVCNDPSIVNKIEELRDHGMRKNKKYWHDSVGFNYRMTNLQAAVGLAQLERINWFIDRKRHIARLYNQHLSGMNKLVLPVERDWAKNSFWMYTILLNKNCIEINRDELITLLKNDGIDSRPVFYPLHTMPPYRESKTYRNAENISAAGLSLPSSVTLEDEQIEYICNMIKKHIGHTTNDSPGQ
jgi:perosamine synthetase